MISFGMMTETLCRTDRIADSLPNVVLKFPFFSAKGCIYTTVQCEETLQQCCAIAYHRHKHKRTGGIKSKKNTIRGRVLLANELNCSIVGTAFLTGRSMILIRTYDQCFPLTKVLYTLLRFGEHTVYILYTS